MADDTPVLRWLEGCSTDFSLLEGTDLHRSIQEKLLQVDLVALLGPDPQACYRLVRQEQLTVQQLWRFRRHALTDFLAQPCFRSFLSDIRLLRRLGFETLDQRLQLLVLQEALQRVAPAAGR